MRNLDEITEECLNMVRTLHIPIKEDTPVKYNGRIRKKWGYCKRTSDNTFEISISTALGEDDVPKKSLMSTILHELLHTCPGCFNHGKLWKSYAQAIKKEYGIHIRTSSDAETMKIKPHYYVKCRKCKVKMWNTMKPANKEGRCPICGSKKLSCFYKKDGVKERIWKR